MYASSSQAYHATYLAFPSHLRSLRSAITAQELDAKSNAIIMANTGISDSAPVSGLQQRLEAVHQPADALPSAAGSSRQRPYYPPVDQIIDSLRGQSSSCDNRGE